MPEFAKSDQPSKGGSSSLQPHCQNSATGWHCWPLVASRSRRSRRCSAVASGRCGIISAPSSKWAAAWKRAENLERLEAAAKGGSIGAMKTLEAIFGHAETKQLQGKSKAAPQPSKRVLAQRAAATAGGARTPWGSDLDWSNGGRSQ